MFREYEMGRVYDTDGRQRNSFRSDVGDKKSETLNRFRRRWEYIIKTGLKTPGGMSWSGFMCLANKQPLAGSCVHIRLELHNTR